jgi:hypothetical protein
MTLRSKRNWNAVVVGLAAILVIIVEMACVAKVKVYDQTKDWQRPIPSSTALQAHLIQSSDYDPPLPKLTMSNPTNLTLSNPTNLTLSNPTHSQSNAEMILLAM